MKTAVAHLEPHMEKTDSQGKGTIVLATVKGDVHDIGKNLVDIILSNNGYTVVNLGIKQPISAILTAAEEHRADAVGMSGLLVKSTVVMKENLQEMNSRGVAAKLPVLLGGAALTRSYVENDLSDVYEGRVDYARDAFEGLRLMDATMARARGTAPAVDPAEEAKRAERKARHERSQRVAARRRAAEAETAGPVPDRSDVALDNPIPTPPFWGTRVVKGLAVAEYAGLVDERALFLGQWGLRGARAGQGPSYEELVETEGRPAAAVLARPAGHRGRAVVGRRRLRLLPGRRRGRHAGGARRAARRRGGAGPLHLPAPAPRPAPVPGRLLAAPRAGRGGRRGGRAAAAPGHDGPADRRLRERAVRQGRLPRLPRGARAGRAAHRGAGRVLAPADPRGADVPDRRARSRPRTPRTSRSTSSSATAAPATRWATAPARTWTTGPSSSTCCSPAASASSCPRSCSCTPSSPPTRSWPTTRRPSTSMPADPPPSLPAAVLWDMDGTLIDSERLWDVSLQATARELGGELSARARDSLVGVDIDTSIVVLLGDVGVAGDPRADRVDLRPARHADRGAVRRRRRRLAARCPRRAAHRARGRAADGAGDQQPAPDHRARARRHRPGVLRRHRLRRRGAGRQARARPLPARRRAARRPDRGAAWRSRTRRTARWRPSGPARPCSWCPARCRCPPGRAACTATTSWG